eukprot:1159574-Pelagomonas_calceolata.AAC.6
MHTQHAPCNDPANPYGALSVCVCLLCAGPLPVPAARAASPPTPAFSFNLNQGSAPNQTPGKLAAF